MDRLAERLFALPLLAVALACLVRAYLLLGGRDFAWGGMVRMLHGPAMLLPVVFLAVGALCLLGALLFWAGLLPGRPSRSTGTPLFGCDAEIDPKGRPGLWRAFLVLPVIAVLTLLADPVLWRGQGQGGEVASPSQPKADEPKIPEPKTNEPKGNDVASAPPAPVLPTPPEVVPPPPAAPAPPEVAVIPPPTVAPLPPPPPAAPTLPDGHRDAVVWLSVAPDGRSILSASTDHVIKLWDIGGKHLIRNLGVHKDMARTALYMPDGLRALTGGDDGEIVLRQLSDGAVLHVFQSGGNGGVNKLAITPDGKRAVSGHDTGNVIVWDLVNNAVLHVLTGHDWSISAVAVSPDGTRAVSGSIDGTLKLWDIESGKQLRSWHGHEQGTYGAVFTADGHHLITGSGDLTIKVWDLDSGREVKRLEGHEGTVYTLALSADGKRLLSGSLDGTARLWDMETGNQIAMFDSQTGPIYAVAFAADGTVLTGGYDRTIRDWPTTGGDGMVLFAGAPG
ncbi:WD40 repeat domain-containing protein [Mesorhizobium sp. Mes31]|uniref:WD40 repeat domain-containing protein n=1 Tax=Mesorhizobium sp. Mes31 TaxID=2926017 RepID=UPI0021178BF3|nr:WD40 repeat domain-containing protein [Mesorhizobium sp. Mes31]